MSSLNNRVATPRSGTGWLTLLGATLLGLVGCDERVRHTGGGQAAEGEAEGAATEDCAGEHVGTWYGRTIDDQLELSADCHYEYEQSSSCRSSGTYTVLPDPGEAEVDITSSTGTGCLPVGSYACRYELESSFLLFDCGAGRFRYATEPRPD